MYKQLWLDCDGVLADFDLGFERRFDLPPRRFEELAGSEGFWSTIRNSPKFFDSLPLMPDARELYGSVQHLRPIILTGCPFGNWAETQKMRWRDKHFPGVPMVTCMSKNKRNYCRPGDVLVDDTLKYKELWEQAGGIFILHTDAKSSILELQKHFNMEKS
jgi:hypothetical protein